MISTKANFFEVRLRDGSEVNFSRATVIDPCLEQESSNKIATKAIFFEVRLRDGSEVVLALPTPSVASLDTDVVDSGTCGYRKFSMEKDIRFKTRKSWNEFGHSHFLTFSTFERRPYLLDHRICRLLSQKVNQAASELDLAILSYVFMPEHVHMLIHPLREEYAMDEILQAIKQGTSQISKNRKWTQTKLWMPGGGFDSNISHPHARLLATGYINQNPVRRGLVEDPLAYRWSSANWYVTGEQGDIECRYAAELWR